jgi:hemerythrin-like domain-containing protein
MSDETFLPATRRRLLRAAGVIAVATAFPLPGALAQVAPPAAAPAEDDEDEVSPAEDLMREHGVLKRVLLVYDEALRRLGAGTPLPPEPLVDAAKVIRTFIEDYHEKLEEEFLFPRLRHAGVQVDLVDVLTAQHRAGRVLTDRTLHLATAASLRSRDGRRELAASLQQFVRMYAPHEAREDTVLFPAFRKIVSAHEYGALGEQFEDREHDLFGADGFESMVERVAGIEKALGIYDLSRFTPNVQGRASS